MDISAQDSMGRTVLHWAIRGLANDGTKALAALEQALERTDSALVNTTTRSGDTPLHWLLTDICEGRISEGDATAALTMLLRAGARRLFSL